MAQANITEKRRSDGLTAMAASAAMLLGPFAVPFLFGSIFKFLGCKADARGHDTCMVLGSDIGNVVYSLSGWHLFSFVAFPAATVIFFIGLTMWLSSFTSTGIRVFSVLIGAWSVFATVVHFGL